MADTIRAAGTLDLTVHRQDPDVMPKLRPATGRGSEYLGATPLGSVREWNGHKGATLCGRPLLMEELWVDYVPEPVDRLCPRCFRPDGVEAG